MTRFFTKYDTLIVFWLGLLGVLFFTLTTIIGTLTIVDYNTISQFISETYATGTPYGKQLRYIGFIPSGIFITLFSFLILKVLPPSRLTSFAFINLGIFYGITTIISSLFPCDAGCDSSLNEVTISQSIHNFIGLLTYLIVPICVLFIGISAKKWPNGNKLSFNLLIFGLVSIIFVGILMVNLEGNYIGLYQRIIEISILLSILNCAFYIKNIKL